MIDGFAELPPALEAALTGAAGPSLDGLPARADRVVVLLLDAFGMRFVQRHAGHPLLRRFATSGIVSEITSQFPSTTTAHVTTMHTGLPVARHGLYEWHVLEPTLGRIVTPLRFAFSGETGDSLSAAWGADATPLLPAEPTLYERLAAAGVQASVHQPDRFSPSVFDRAAARGATLHPYGALADGLREALGHVQAAGRAYAYVYFDLIDTQGHLTGPASSAFDAQVRETLDEVEGLLAGVAAKDVWLVLTADHGQIDVDPESVLWLDELHPPLATLPLRPAGSSRDVFLHVPAAEVAGTVDALRGALGDAAEVLPVADLLAAGAFGPDPAPALLDRLASVCVLPAPGRLAWLRRAADHGTTFRGHHGGRTPEETRTHVSVLRLG